MDSAQWRCQFLAGFDQRGQQEVSRAIECEYSKSPASETEAILRLYACAERVPAIYEGPLSRLELSARIELAKLVGRSGADRRVRHACVRLNGNYLSAGLAEVTDGRTADRALDQVAPAGTVGSLARLTAVRGTAAARRLECAEASEQAP